MLGKPQLGRYVHIRSLTFSSGPDPPTPSVLEVRCRSMPKAIAG